MADIYLISPCLIRIFFPALQQQLCGTQARIIFALIQFWLQQVLFKIIRIIGWDIFIINFYDETFRSYIEFQLIDRQIKSASVPVSFPCAIVLELNFSRISKLLILINFGDKTILKWTQYT